MRSLLLALLLLTSPETPKPPSFSVSPHTAPSPAVITFLLKNIPTGSVTACFVLEGSDNEIAGCVDVAGRKSYRREERNVPSDIYVAAVSLDAEWLPTQRVIITE